MATLVDSNVLLDIFKADPTWCDWSLTALAQLQIERFDLPWDAAHLAALAFLAYRRSGGGKTAPLPDFYIYAHAQKAGLTLLTRDARRCRTYFPKIQPVCPT